MFIAQSGPISISLVALSAQDAALPAISDVLMHLHSSPLSFKTPKITSQEQIQSFIVLTLNKLNEPKQCHNQNLINQSNEIYKT